MTEVVSNKKLQKKLLKGASILNDAVSSTLGPYGRTTLLTNSEGKLTATKDGVTVAKEFKKLKDFTENAGAQMIKEVSIKSANEAGDGTTTSTLLAYSMLNEGIKLIENGSNPTLVKKGMDQAVDEVLEGIKDFIEDIVEDEQINEVAKISGNNDIEIGNLIMTAFQKVGREGVISLEKSKNGETKLDVVEGMQFDKGYLSPYFVTDNDKMDATLDNPLIFIYNGRISSPNDILELMQYASTTENKSLLIIADEVEGQALSTLVVNKMRGILNSVAVKSPDFGDRRKFVLEDIATITGGKVLSPQQGVVLDKMSIDEIKDALGTCRIATIDKEKTTIIDGDCSEDDILKRVKLIQTQLENAKSSFEKEKLQERIGNLSGGVALISVGGNSEVEISERKDRVEDALFATQAAIAEGVVPGGGCALLRGRNFIKFEGTNKDIDLGKQIIYNSISQPFLRILQNSGMEFSKALILSENLKLKEDWIGYNIATDELVNMKDNGILDPYKVVKLALKNSSSVVGTLLTTNSLVYEKVDKSDGPSQMMY